MENILLNRCLNIENYNNQKNVLMLKGKINIFIDIILMNI